MADASRKLRIMHLIHTPRHSGAEALVRDLCLLHMKCGIESAVASFSPSETAFTSQVDLLANSQIKLFIPSRSLKKSSRVLHLRCAYSNFQPHVIFGHSVLPSLYGRISLPLTPRRSRFVTVLHSASNDDFAAPYLRVLEFFLSRRADEIVAVSEQGAKAYESRFDRSSPVKLIKNGINLRRFTNVSRSSARTSLGIPRERKILIQIGRVSPVKQQGVSISLTAALLESGIDVEIWLAGLTEDSDYKNRLSQLVDSLDLGDRVKFLGSRSDVPELLAVGDLYLMPSLQEAHSIALLEALASGIPVLASDIRPFEFAKQFDAVRLVDSKNAAELKASAVKLLAEARPEARDMEEYDITRTADQYALLALELFRTSSDYADQA